ncbi:hypothetical protein IAR55_003240 [Kwoniella newhampshirensis]|uniref:RIC1 C-terminal alpha solenoid region domain-containing protein n=1 Tax=Kwoniella newhampshirensis TaxID=1651941 RepID=A0AAW0YQE9_9TREE
MYWPTATTRLVNTPSPLEGRPALRIRASRKGNFFATLTKDGLSPTVMQAAVVRSTGSIERFGNNVDVFWAYDGRGLIVLTDTSHLLFYQLVPTSRPSYDSSGPSTPGPGEGDVVMGWQLRSLGTAFIMGGCESVLPQPHNLIMTLRHPPSLLTIPYPVPSPLLSPPGSHFPPPPLDGETEAQIECDTWDLNNAREWLTGDVPPIPKVMTTSRTPGLPVVYTVLASDGRAYVIYQASQLAQIASSDAQNAQLNAGPKYVGQVIHPPPIPQDLVKRTGALGLLEDKLVGVEDLGDVAVNVSVNPRFGVVAVGLASGKINIITLPPWPSQPRLSHSLDLRSSANLRTKPGTVTGLAWTGDGYCLAAGYEYGWAAWSMGGRLGGWGVRDEDDLRETGVLDLFWVPGNLELVILRPHPQSPQIEVISFVKSATTTQHSPMDDRVLVYRGADQPDMSVINPESDVWQSIKIPSAYIATNWPLRYASISSDGKLIAVAGRKGLTHYSAASGRWKLFPDERQEREFTVRGGLLWFHHVLIAAVDADKTHQIRLYSRDLDLTEILHSQTLPFPVLVMTLLDNSLLVYTADNTLYHFLILPTQSTIKLHLCGSISFRGIVQIPSRVRALSWLIPLAQKNLGDPADDLIVATIIFLVDGKLVLLRPRRARPDEVRYDMQILADRIEAYWTHLHGVGTLENSLWGYDGANMRIWLDALTIEATRVDSTSDSYENVEESVKLRLDFYPLSILMDKGIIIGVDYETSTRTLPFPVYKISTGTHLFLPQFLRYHLSSPTPSLVNALTLALHYQSLVYFAHSLEILLHSVLEDEVASKSLPRTESYPQVEAASLNDGTEQANSTDKLDGRSHTKPPPNVLATVITFLDHFPESLDVIVGCARKTEIDRWKVLFDIVGKPRDLFERCLGEGNGVGGKRNLRTAASYLLVLHNLEELDDVEDTIRLLRQAIKANEFHLCKELLRFLHSIDENGTALRAAVEQVGILQSDLAGSVTGHDPEYMTADDNLEHIGQGMIAPHTPSITLSPSEPKEETSALVATSTGSPPSPDVHSSTPPLTTDLPPTPSDASATSNPDISDKREKETGRGHRKVDSQFDLVVDRLYQTPPSPRTVDRFEDHPSIDSLVRGDGQEAKEEDAASG